MLLGAYALPATGADTPHFDQTGPVETDSGYTTLSWTSGGEVSLEQARSADMADAETLYSGANHALFVSGLADGQYYYALRDSAGQRSEPLLVNVTHQSLTQALLLTAIGAIVFLAAAGVILRGARDE